MCGIAGYNYIKYQENITAQPTNSNGYRTVATGPSDIDNDHHVEMRPVRSPHIHGSSKYSDDHDLSAKLMDTAL